MSNFTKTEHTGCDPAVCFICKSEPAHEERALEARVLSAAEEWSHLGDDECDPDNASRVVSKLSNACAALAAFRERKGMR